MKALVLEDVEKLRVADIPDPIPDEDGVVIRVMASGVCRSDWHFWVGDTRVPMPLVMGHEFAGVVEATGRRVTRLKRGDRVTVPFTGSEGTCDQCLSGHSHLCDSMLMPGITYPGGYAEYVSVPHADRNVVHLPDAIDFVSASALGCRFMTAFHGLVDRASVAPGEWVVVYGCGGVGLSAVNIASALGARVIAVDINPANLDLARQMGAVHVIDSRAEDPVHAVLDWTHGGAHVAVDALGIAQTCVNAIRSLRKRGRHLQIGMTTRAEAGFIAIPVDDMIKREIQFTTAFGMPAHRFSALLPLVADGTLTPGRMVTRTVALSEVAGIFEGMKTYSHSGTYVVTEFL